ncbi:MAG: TetR/AcrR family transcriptional regulator [Dehalococcoidia bacterium]|nr:TetR/AcrR family transcriptional regulator [Dehalococcoidia bacterium]MBE0610752.1 TetR/AcrR family transcriptional regulator [Dehalococcoidia bacterium]
MHSHSGRRDTAQEILDVAQSLAQTRGYNGFSYADISHVLGITKASLHYHFPTKEALGQALMERYADQFRSALAGIAETASSALEMVERYVCLYRDVLVVDRLCLCGMLAAEVTTLPPSIQDEVRAFFDMNERWLSDAFARGRQEGTLRIEQEPAEGARLFMGALEGAMLVARSYYEPQRFDADSQRLITLFLGNAIPS